MNIQHFLGRNGLKNESLLQSTISMPSHGVEIIDGIPVILKEGQMYAFQTQPPIKLGTYIDKKATWIPTEEVSSWLTSYQASMVSRSRK
jgi:hypothetical protein